MAKSGKRVLLSKIGVFESKFETLRFEDSMMSSELKAGKSDISSIDIQPVKI